MIKSGNMAIAEKERKTEELILKPALPSRILTVRESDLFSADDVFKGMVSNTRVPEFKGNSESARKNAESAANFELLMNKFPEGKQGIARNLSHAVDTIVTQA
jgi:hypothetical protein